MENFAPYELAVKLKEKGFREECLCHYIGNDLVYNIESPIANNQLWFSHNKFDNIWHRDNIDAPTISQVLKWLREEKKIHVSPNIGYTGWFFDIEEILDLQEHTQMYKTLYTDIEDYNTYELAALAGIEYCLDNLI